MRRRALGLAGSTPLPPGQKWRAITIATIVLVPAYWSMLAGLVAFAADGTGEASGGGVANPGAAVVFGLALVPFVFIALAFLSWQPNPPAAVTRAMGLSAVVGVLVSAVAVDVVTGIVAGVGAGGIVALRREDGHGWRPRAAAVAFATVYTFVLVRIAGPIVLLSAPVFPFTALGLADHLVDRRADRPAAA